ncbi:DUF1622 domain-containing protein [Massilia niastensis]|uniref:DUF1622 domain-containing protein n=1 Tax=Massilia niastensis TaxID=544911 RepID=UPI000593B1B9|nr:DUF1622 domain-containing protein [Massilia niastensis]
MNQRMEAGLFDQVEEHVRSHVEWLRLLVEALGALVVAAGVAVVIVGLVRHLLARPDDHFIPIRLAFARYLTLALELQLAADILSTSVAPTWDRIGKLAAIAVIRTVLNHFLTKEINDERARVEPARQRSPASGPAATD